MWKKVKFAHTLVLVWVVDMAAVVCPSEGGKILRARINPGGFPGGGGLQER